MKHGFFSQKYVDAGYGTSLWWNHDRTLKVEVGAVCDSREDGEKNFLWDDKVYVGEVSEWAGLGRRDQWRI